MIPDVFLIDIGFSNCRFPISTSNTRHIIRITVTSEDGTTTTLDVPIGAGSF